MNELSGWQNFYVIVGSSAGALIGLQFVVITLIADYARAEDAERAGSAFATPTIVHFGAVLLLAAILTAPWYGIGPLAIVLGVFGVSGVIYAIFVARLAYSQSAYKPEFEDWLFHVLLPLLAYGTLAICSYESHSHIRHTLFCIAATALLLLFIGIHNAWDAVTYHVFVVSKRGTREAKPPR